MSYLHSLPKELRDLLNHYINYEHLHNLNDDLFLTLGEYVEYDNLNENNFFKIDSAIEYFHKFMTPFNIKYSILKREENNANKRIYCNIIIDAEEVISYDKMLEIISSKAFLDLCVRQRKSYISQRSHKSADRIIGRINNVLELYGYQIYIQLKFDYDQYKTTETLIIVPNVKIDI